MALGPRESVSAEPYSVDLWLVRLVSKSDPRVLAPALPRPPVSNAAVSPLRVQLRLLALCATLLQPFACGSDAGGGGVDDDAPAATEAGGDAGVDQSRAPDARGSDAGVRTGVLVSEVGPPRCGDGWLDPGETCDGSVPFPPSCAERGFDTGRLVCTATCTWTTESCAGIENCADGRDNDGDAETDCADPDCVASCADACSAPIAIVAGSFTGTTEGHAPGLDSSCNGSVHSGARVVYRLDLTEASTLDVSLSSPHALGLSVAPGCAEAESLVCGGRTRLSLNAVAGSYFIAVDAETPDAAGEYSLSVQTREAACGDGVRDPGEACDDGNLDDGDGCDPDCGLEASESEPNDTRLSADRFVSGPWFGQISPAGDVDYYRVQLTASASSLLVDTFNLGDGACALNLMDSVIEILDTTANDNVVLVRDEDGGDGSCARAMTGGLPPGTYYVRVSAAAAAQPATFPYRLGIRVGVCGDGHVDLGEGCDDQNVIDGDGCAANCQEEP